MKEIYVTLYTKEKGKLEFTKEEWYDFDIRYVTYHREDGPAIIRSNMLQEYWLNDKRHREDGPAVVSSNGSHEYWLNGKRHREDGHAVVYSDGTQRFYLNGVYYSKEDYYKKLEEIDSLSLSLKLIHNEQWVRERAKK